MNYYFNCFVVDSAEYVCVYIFFIIIIRKS